MKTSIINGTLSDKDAYLRFDLPRFEQTLKNLLNHMDQGLKTIRDSLDNGVTINAQGQKFKITPEQIQEFSPDLTKEAETIADAVDAAFKKIGYTSKYNPPAAAVAGAQVVEATSKSPNLPPTKTATITPAKK